MVSCSIPQLNEPNTSQQHALQNAVRRPFSLIQGPPGTGKTITGVRLAYIFAEINRQRRTDEPRIQPQVLYCGPSNKSVDVVAGIKYNHRSFILTDVYLEVLYMTGTYSQVRITLTCCPGLGCRVLEMPGPTLSQVGACLQRADRTQGLPAPTKPSSTQVQKHLQQRLHIWHSPQGYRATLPHQADQHRHGQDHL